MINANYRFQVPVCDSTLAFKISISSRDTDTSQMTFSFLYISGDASDT